MCLELQQAYCAGPLTKHVTPLTACAWQLQQYASTFEALVMSSTIAAKQLSVYEEQLSFGVSSPSKHQTKKATHRVTFCIVQMLLLLHVMYQRVRRSEVDKVHIEDV